MTDLPLPSVPVQFAPDYNIEDVKRQMTYIEKHVGGRERLQPAALRNNRVRRAELPLSIQRHQRDMQRDLALLNEARTMEQFENRYIILLHMLERCSSVPRMSNREENNARGIPTFLLQMVFPFLLSHFWERKNKTKNKKIPVFQKNTLPPLLLFLGTKKNKKIPYLLFLLFL
jgi:hypothetical protein